MSATQTGSAEQLREQLLEDIQKLPADLLQELSEIVARLHLKTTESEFEQRSEQEEVYPYEALKKSGLIGCMEAPSDLSVNYKEYLAEGLKEKHGHH